MVNFLKKDKTSFCFSGNWRFTRLTGRLLPPAVPTNMLASCCAYVSRSVHMEKEARVVKLMKPVPLTPDSFQPYGQVIAPSPDGAVFGPEDAQLRLNAGIPRFYIMRLEHKPLKFNNITHHASVTQCLGSVGALPWYIGVAKPSIVQHSSHDTHDHVQSKAGHYYIPPSPEEVQVFRVDGPQFLKFHVGTWHAGPLFKERTMDFYNLELSDTNVVDHTAHKFDGENGTVFVIDD